MSSVPAIPQRAPSKRPPPQGPFDAASTPWGYALLFITLFFGVGGVFAYTAPLATSVIATGQVVAEGERRTVQALETGTIADVRFAEGDRVATGDLVVQLDTTDIESRLGATLTSLRQAAAREGRLLAERNGDVVISWSHSSLQDVTDPAVAEILAAEQRLFTDRRERRETQRQIIEQRVAQLRTQIEGEEMVLTSLMDRQAIAGSELADNESLVNSGLATRGRLLALQREEAELRGQIGATRASIAGLYQNIGEAEVQITELRSAFLEEVSEALPVAQRERVALEDEYSRLLLSLQRRALRASVDGRIIELKHSGPGPVVAPGEVLFEIVPDQDGVSIEAAIRPSDIEAVSVGMEARVVFSALALQEARSTTGMVTRISPDVFTNEANGEQFFKVRVTVDEQRIAEDLPDLDLVMGMATEVYIVSGEQTLLEYLADPIRQVLDRGLRE